MTIVPSDVYVRRFVVACIRPNKCKHKAVIVGKIVIDVPAFTCPLIFLIDPFFFYGLCISIYYLIIFFV